MPGPPSVVVVRFVGEENGGNQTKEDHCLGYSDKKWALCLGQAWILNNNSRNKTISIHHDWSVVHKKVVIRCVKKDTKLDRFAR